MLDRAVLAALRIVAPCRRRVKLGDGARSEQFSRNKLSAAGFPRTSRGANFGLLASRYYGPTWTAGFVTARAVMTAIGRSTAAPLRRTGTPLSPNGVTRTAQLRADYMAIGRITIVLPRPAASSRRRVIQEVLVARSTGKLMRCQNCSAENPQGAKFCIQCSV
jgi:hypothetical protein